MIDQILANNDYYLMFGFTVILLTGLAFGKLSKWLHIPNVTGYLVGGFLIGPGFLTIFFPSFPGVIGPNFIHALKIIADIELAFIAFSIGAEFKLEYLKRLGPSPIIIAFFESFFAVVFIAGGLLLFGFPLYIALAFGAVGGATAPAATVMVIRQYKARGPLTEMIYSVVAIDDASGLIFFGIITAIIRIVTNQSQGAIGWLLILPVLEIIASITFGVLLGFALKYLADWFTGRGNRIAIVIATIFFSIGFARYITGTFAFGLSSLMAGMAMGAIFTNTSKHVDHVMPLVERITPPLVIMFFVLSGADIQLGSFNLVTLWILIIYLVFRVFGKIFGSYLGARVSKAGKQVEKYLGFGLLPQGGIALGLSILMLDIIPNDLGLPYDGGLLRVVIIGAVFVSEVFGPILLKQVLIKAKETNVDNLVPGGK
jgi:Kef-type K+ transport system membrane component KefB